LERVLDVLLGVPVDLGATRIVLEPGPMVVDLSLTVGEESRPVTSMADPLYQQILDRLRPMIGLATSVGQGVLALHSSRRTDRISVELAQAEHGIRSTIEIEGEAVPRERASAREPAVLALSFFASSLRARRPRAAS